MLINGFTLYREECMEEYYKDGDYCKPCHTSWKSWTQAGEWTSCHDYMTLNLTSNLWQSCNDGEYLDYTAQTCRPWAGSWIGNCRYQQSWFAWSPGESFDLESLTWVSDWDPNRVKVESNKLKI